jgi:hypothetical protein
MSDDDDWEVVKSFTGEYGTSTVWKTRKSCMPKYIVEPPEGECCHNTNSIEYALQMVRKEAGVESS